MGSYKEHERLLYKKYWELVNSKKYDFVAHHVCFDRPYALGMGETDIIAGDLKQSILEIYEIKSTNNYKKGSRQVKRAYNFYFKQFRFEENRLFVLYKDYGLERLILTETINFKNEKKGLYCGENHGK